MAALSPTISPAGHNEFKYKLTKLLLLIKLSFYVSFYMSSLTGSLRSRFIETAFYVSFYVSACYTGLKGRYASVFYVSSSCVFYISSTNR